MSSNYLVFRILIGLCLFVCGYCNEDESNSLIESADGREGSWMKSAKEVLTGPAGQMVVHVAKELINRSLGNSQVLSLNLGNLLILLLLKALIFLAGYIGAGHGHWSHHARGRSSGSLLLNEESTLYLGFLAAQGTGNDSCLQKSACYAPEIAYEYARAAKSLLEGIERFGSSSEDKQRYDDLIAILQRGAYEGYQKAPCDIIYSCEIV